MFYKNRVKVETLYIYIIHVDSNDFGEYILYMVNRTSKQLMEPVLSLAWILEVVSVCCIVK